MGLSAVGNITGNPPMPTGSDSAPIGTPSLLTHETDAVKHGGRWEGNPLANSFHLLLCYLYLSLYPRPSFHFCYAPMVNYPL